MSKPTIDLIMEVEEKLYALKNKYERKMRNTGTPAEIKIDDLIEEIRDIIRITEEAQ